MPQNNEREAFEDSITALSDALRNMINMHDLMMKQTNFGASFYNANCFKEMNEAPIKAKQALVDYEKFSEVEFVIFQGVNHDYKIDYFKHWWDGLPENVREYFNQSDSMSAFNAGMHFNVNKLKESPISQNEQQEAVAVLNSTWGSDTGWQYNIKLLPSFETDKYLESIEGHDIYLYLSPPKQAIPEDSRRLNWIADEAVSIDTYGMDDSFGWIFTQYYINEKEPREIYRSFTEDLRKSIDQAILNAAPTTSLTSETNTEVGE